jgi:hypothetical protein
MRSLAGMLSTLVLASPAFADAPAARIVPPDDRATWSFMTDNDLFGGTDKYFTAGWQLAYRSAADVPPGWLDRFADSLAPLVSPDSSRRWGLALGQKIFTPEDIETTAPDPDDRPYAGWLYGAVTLSSATDTRYGSLELQAGVVGPSALGEEVQNNTHELLNIGTANGWSEQLDDEPGINLVFSRLGRYNFPFDETKPRGLAWGVVPSGVASLGNVQTYAGAGAMLRIGKDLYADFGPPRQRPQVAGSAFVEPVVDDWGWYVFGGIDGRLVVRDISLDGNTFKSSRSVDKQPIVADGSLGAALLLPWGRIAYVHTFRTQEFEGQATLAEFGTLSLSVRF